MRGLGPLITIASALYLVTMMFALGLELGAEPKPSTQQKRANRQLLIRGLALNLVAIPAVAFGVTRAFHASSDVATALLLLVAAPGGRYAPHLVKLGRGNVALAAELALFLAKITGFTAAPMAKAMLTLKTLEVRDLPFLVQVVLLQLVPFSLGKWLGRNRRALAGHVLKPAHVTAIAMAVLTFAVVILREDRGLVRLLDDRAWFAVLAVGIASPVLAWFAGGRNEGARRAFAIGSNSRELALALVMASVVFPQTGVHTALFGVWSLMVLASFLLAAGLHERRTSGAREGRSDDSLSHSPHASSGGA